ncbi:carbon-nitrogen hydrolase family protein [Clostridium frigidicarnis]|uniref:Carbon-nitrogen hydrolase n=1 Tax=Clostridium frigidicarnis TaxID=84698 RepID=A0A1I0YBE9_9CLOT|nr:carbon-nitrogen hydrolase family protein [Clostridium frigidicarnis]SFB10522.1 Carbon-nitrogen hydrolase [Clostridium frigidicarnis]
MYKIALIVPKITNDIHRNKRKILSFVRKAYKKKAKLILFPECTVNGIGQEYNDSTYYNDSNTENDVFIKSLCRLAKLYKINIAIGVLENKDKIFYDSLFFINENGVLQSKYRRISLWDNNRNICKCGQNYKLFNTDIGVFSSLICGDLFYEKIRSGLEKVKFDYLLYPVAISFDNNSIDKNLQWKNEIKEYSERIKHIGKTTFMTNYIGSKNHFYKCYGGATVFNINGEIIKSMPIMREGILYFDL